MKLIVGLGNPGPRYRETRHNVGFQVIDELAARHGLSLGASHTDALVAKWRTADDVVLVAKPLTFMNLSGQAVAELGRYYRIEPADLLVVSDDVHLPLGRLRARRGGSAGGHNGLKSIIELLGTDAFPRLRIGVGRGDDRRDLADHVLAKFESSERLDVDMIVKRAADAAAVFVSDGIEAVMNGFNKEPDVTE